jgi:hypothetical protein
MDKYVKLIEDIINLIEQEKLSREEELLLLSKKTMTLAASKRDAKMRKLNHNKLEISLKRKGLVNAKGNVTPEGKATLEKMHGKDIKRIGIGVLDKMAKKYKYPYKK